MAAFTYTYSTLKTAIINHTEDDSTEFANMIDDFIGLAELRIARELDLDVFRKYSTSSLTSSSRYLSKPSDFVIDRFMYITVSSSVVYLQRKDVSYLADYWPATASTSQPLYYSEWDDDTFVLAPTPDSGYSVTLGYTYRPARLDGTATTTWLSTKAPDLLLWACLSEAGAFLQEMGQGQEPGMLSFWESKYAQARDRVMDEELRRQRMNEDRYGESRGGA